MTGIGGRNRDLGAQRLFLGEPNPYLSDPCNGGLGLACGSRLRLTETQLEMHRSGSSNEAPS
jgi:hypothetical protein